MSQYGVSLMPLQPKTVTVISAAASQRIQLDGLSVQFSVGTQGLWYKFGNSAVTATAGTAGEGYVPANQVIEVLAPAGATHVAIIQAAVTAVGSVTTF